MIAGRRVSLDELTDDIDGVRALLLSGEARLEVVTFSWGLSFNLVEAPKRTAALLTGPVSQS